MTDYEDVLWSPALDASDLRAEACDDAVAELYRDRDSWVEEEVPGWDEW